MIFNAESTQNDFDKSRINDNLDTSIQTESIHEFQNLFYKTLYDKLAPECNDTNQQLEHSLYNTDMVINIMCFFITFIIICLSLSLKE